MYRFVLRSIAKLAMSSMFVFPLSLSAQALEVYLFRGAGDLSFVNKNLHFSKGLEEIADTMNAEGIRAEVRRFEAIDDALKTIRQRRPESVAFIGHSMGALASMNMARRMREEGIRVAYIGLIDIPGPVGVAGDNVEWAENFYSIHPIYGLLTNAKSHPRAENIHVSGFIHNRMDNSPFVQKRMLDAVRQIHYAEQQQRLQFEQQQLVETYNEPQPVYTPPVPEVAVNAENITQDNLNYGIDTTVTTSVTPSYQEPQNEGILSRAERFLNKITKRSGTRNSRQVIENNR